MIYMNLKNLNRIGATFARLPLFGQAHSSLFQAKKGINLLYHLDF